MKYTLVRKPEEEGEESSITLFVSGRQPLAATSSNPKFEEIVTLVLANDDKAIDLLDQAAAAATRFEPLTERVSVRGGSIFLDGVRMDNSLTKQVIRFIEEDQEDWKPLVNFFEKVQTNLSENSRQQLYSWLEKHAFSITPEGMIVAYKGVSSSVEEGVFYSTTAGTAIVNDQEITGYIPQKVGDVVTMPRDQVADNPNAACSTGLHVATHDFAKSYGDTMLEVHINPRDAVSVPNDSNVQKMRVCRYTVVAVIEKEYTEPVVRDFVEPARANKKSRSGNKSKGQVKSEKPVEEVRVGDVYADTDARRAGRTVKVTGLEGGKALLEDENGKPSKVKVERLTSRAFNRMRRGRKPKVSA